ncbi:hypothetical protein [Paraburkholderia sp. 2C]
MPEFFSVDRFGSSHSTEYHGSPAGSAHVGGSSTPPHGPTPTLYEPPASGAGHLIGVSTPASGGFSDPLRLRGGGGGWQTKGSDLQARIDGQKRELDYANDRLRSATDAVNTARATMRDLEARYDAARRSTPDSPEVAQLSSQLAQLNHEIHAQMREAERHGLAATAAKQTLEYLERQ